MFYVQLIYSIDERFYPCAATVCSALQEIFGMDACYASGWIANTSSTDWKSPNWTIVFSLDREQS